MTSPRSRFRPLLAALLMAALVIAGAGGISTASPAPGSVFVTANGIPMQVGDQLSIFKFNPPQIDPQKDTSPLSQRFSGIYARQAVGQETYLGKPRYTVANTTTTSLLTQYGATGGFYAYNVSDVAPETERGVRA